MPNRLAQAASLYLRQHAENPVDWRPWGAEAFAEAEALDRPVFLSSGYSSCHWCHVMAHESFEDAEIADLLNRLFVPIKLDREEHPDVDDAYMRALTLYAGHGGWPMSIFCLPNGDPFYMGTYFPKEDRGGRPGFRSLLQTVAQTWHEERLRVEQMADHFGTELRRLASHPAPQARFAHDFDGLVDAVAAEYDPEHPGFGTRPKFPQTATLGLMARARPDLAETVLWAMARGGIHDHVGGGFHRYSTDERWLLPHFEKMLYDNACLLELYARSEDPGLRWVGQRIADWLEREMKLPNGCFAAALDADSEGEEGKFYVWTADELRAALGDRAPAFMAAYRVEEEGNFLEEATGHRTGSNVLHTDGGPLVEDLARLLEVRASRVRPARDEKALVGWNGLAISGLAAAGRREAAEAAARAILAADPLPHLLFDGEPSGIAYLEDYAAMARACFDLGWEAEGRRLTSEMVERFYDPTGGFWGTQEGHDAPFGRTKPVQDHPYPGGNTLAIECLRRAGDVVRWETSLGALRGWAERAPTGCPGLVRELAGFRPAATEATPGAVLALEPAELTVGPEGTAEAILSIDVAPGMYLWAPDSPAENGPLAFEIEGAEARVFFPETEDGRLRGRVELHFELTPRAPEWAIHVLWQTCRDEACDLPRKTTFRGAFREP